MHSGRVSQHAVAFNRVSELRRQLLGARLDLHRVVDEERRRHTNDLLARIPEQLLRSFVENLDRQLGVGCDDRHIGSGSENRPEHRRRLGEFNLGALSLGDVIINPDHQQRLAGRTALDAGGGLQVPHFATGTQDPKFGVEVCLAADRANDLAFRPCSVVGV